MMPPEPAARVVILLLRHKSLADSHPRPLTGLGPVVGSVLVPLPCPHDVVGSVLVPLPCPHAVVAPCWCPCLAPMQWWAPSWCPCLAPMTWWAPDCGPAVSIAGTSLALWEECGAEPLPKICRKRTERHRRHHLGHRDKVQEGDVLLWRVDEVGVPWRRGGPVGDRSERDAASQLDDRRDDVEDAQPSGR
eukprot:364868-Chlamydomonas_euryale.AAC.11